MKKSKWLFPVLGIVCCILAASLAYAAGSRKTVKAYYGGIEIYLNDEKQIAKDINGKTVEPLLYEGTVYVPVRAVSQWFGKAVTWRQGPDMVLIDDAVFSEADVLAAKAVVEDLFNLFKEKKYTDMNALCTSGGHPDYTVYDFSKGVFGMQKAELLSCTYDANRAARTQALVFLCSFEMTPSPNSIYDASETETSFFVLVEKQEDQFLIREFVSGV